MEPTKNAPEPMKMPKNAPAATDNEAVVTNGPVLVLLAVILLMLLGGLYYWFTVLKTDTASTTAPIDRPSREDNNEPESTTAEAQTDTFGVVSSSNELAAIEADIEATNLDALDAELNAIDAELEASAE